jgi:hypothetical protein
VDKRAGDVGLNGDRRTGGGLADSRNFQAVQEISVQQMQLVFLLSFFPYLPDYRLR